MSDTEPTTIVSEDLNALTKTARLQASQDRMAELAPELDGILQLLDALDAVELSETPPTNSFDARWRTKS